MSNIRQMAIIKSPPSFELKRSQAHFAMFSDSTADPSQDKGGSGQVEIQSFMLASAKRRSILRSGWEFKSRMVGAGQVYRPAPQESPDCAFVFPFNRWNLLGHGSLTPSSQIPAYPATNTYLPQRSKVWRSTSTTASLTRDLANPYRINSICIVSHNMTKDGTFRVRISNSASFATVKYDSGVQPIWEPSFSTSGLYQEEADASGFPSNELIEMLRYCGANPRVVRWIIFDEVNARYVKIDFTDTANPRSLIEVAYVYAGLCIRINPDQVYGWTLVPVGYSRVKKSASGSPWVDVFYRQMIGTANFASHPEAQSLAFWNFLAGYLGKKKEFIIAFQPDNIPKKFWFTLFGRFKETPQLENIASGSYNNTMEIEELVG